MSVGGAAVTAGKANEKGAIKEFVFKLSEPILKRMISSKEDDVMKSWTNTMLSNTKIASSPTQRNIRYHLEQNDGLSVLATLQNNKVKYDPYSTTNPIKPGPNTDTDTRLAFACRNNIPYVDNLLKERVGSSAMVTNTLVNALFEDIKKTMKAQGISEIQTISSNILQTVTDILASMDSYEKIAIFCILGLLLIVNFTALFYMWRNQRESNTSIKLLGDRINDIQIQNEARPLSRTTSNRFYPATAPFQTTKH